VKLSLQYPELVPPAQALELVRAADRLGYDTVWVTESYGFDCMSTLGFVAARTTRIKLATGIANVYSRSPALLAQSAVTIDALSGGRFVLGLGTSGRAVVEGWHGIPFEQPLQRLREAVEVIRMAIRRERLVFDGRAIRLEQGIRLLPEPVRETIPIYLASLSRAGAALAGEVADGLLPVLLSIRHLEALFAEPIATGAARGGRDPAECRLCAFGVPMIVTNDRAAGRDLERQRLALYVGGMGTPARNYYNDLFVRYGYAAEAAEIQRLYLDKQREAATAAVTDAMVDEVSVIGTADECKARLAEYEAAGVDEVVMLLKTPAGDPRGLMTTLEQLAPVR
jgi:F420-dependent oxidoreductase-like protein